MKKIIVTLLSGLLISGMTSNAQEVNLPATIAEVTVFLQGAQVLMRADASLQQGKTVLKITKLPPSLDKNSLQVKGDGAFTIQSVHFRINYLDSLEISQERETLMKKLEGIQRDIDDLKNHSDIIVAKDRFLNDNRVVGGKDSPLSPEAYRQLYEHYCRFVETEKKEWFDLMKKIAGLEKEKTRIQQHLNENINRQQGKSTGEVLITVGAKNPAQAKFQLSYVISNSGWYPSYDIRVEDITKPISLVYKANVYQQTGVDWKNVRLKLSNATPFLSGAIPVLQPYYLRYRPVQPKARYNQGAPAAQLEGVAISRTKDVEDMGRYEAFRENTQILEVSTTERQTNVEFEVDASYTVAADGKPQLIELQRYELPADYQYQAVPKIEKHAFLAARIRDWEQYNLLDGETNLYFENTYVGKSSLNLSAISDTLNLSLGRDRAVVVSRMKQKDFTQKQFIGGNRIETRQLEIAVRNNKSQAVKLKLTDQVPVSTVSDIEVDVQEISGGSLDKNTGEVNWTIDLEPKSVKKLILKYSVKYPKNQHIILE